MEAISLFDCPPNGSTFADKDEMVESLEPHSFGHVHIGFQAVLEFDKARNGDSAIAEAFGQ